MESEPEDATANCCSTNRRAPLAPFGMLAGMAGEETGMDFEMVVVGVESEARVTGKSPPNRESCRCRRDISLRIAAMMEDLGGILSGDVIDASSASFWEIIVFSVEGEISGVASLEDSALEDCESGARTVIPLDGIRAAEYVYGV